MRYYVLDKDTNEKIYLRISDVFTREELWGKFGSTKFKVDGKQYHVDDIMIQSDNGIWISRRELKHQKVIARYFNKTKLSKVIE